MLDTLQTARPAGVRTAARTSGAPRTRLALELRVLAADMAGTVDRDELSRMDEVMVEDALDAAVAAALPAILEVLDRELTPRMESLPLGTRLTLARARRRVEFGVD